MVAFPISCEIETSRSVPHKMWDQIWVGRRDVMGKLTAARLKSLTKPGRYSDGDGLFLVVKPTGGRNWVLRALCGGKRRDIGLGSLKSVELGDAREAAHQIRRQIAKGPDPIAERRRERQVIPTFRDAAKIVHAEHKASWKNGKHQSQWLSTLESYAFPKLGARLVSDIGAPEIRDVPAPIWLSKPETARRGSGRFWIGHASKASGQGSPTPVIVQRLAASAEEGPTLRGDGLRRCSKVRRAAERAGVDRSIGA